MTFFRRFFIVRCVGGPESWRERDMLKVCFCFACLYRCTNTHIRMYIILCIYICISNYVLVFVHTYTPSFDVSCVGGPESRRERDMLNVGLYSVFVCVYVIYLCLYTQPHHSFVSDASVALHKQIGCMYFFCVHTFWCWCTYFLCIAVTCIYTCKYARYYLHINM